VNTDVNRGGDLDYDPVPFLTLTSGAKQMGQLLLMGEDTSNVVVYSNGEVPSMMSWGIDVAAHFYFNYIDRLNAYQGKGGLSTRGWAKDFACNVDEECESEKCGGSLSYWKSGTCEDQ